MHNYMKTKPKDSKNQFLYRANMNQANLFVPFHNVAVAEQTQAKLNNFGIISILCKGTAH